MLAKWKEKWKYVSYVVFHPVEGFDEMRYKKGGSVGVAIVLYLAFLFSVICQQKYMGKQFTFVNDAEVSIQTTFLATLGLMLAAVFANWGFCVLMDGKARIKDLWVIFNYSLVPYTAFSYITVLLSNFATNEEGALTNVLLWVGILWTAFLLLRSLMAYHEFSFSGAIGSVFLTVIGVVIILFLLILLVSLFQKIFSTISVIFYEISFRF
ncbi:MAG: YIP1 family protein [Clostridia bacterium]|nr:YIP1 family protein [Clostridia bacterium]